MAQGLRSFRSLRFLLLLIALAAIALLFWQRSHFNSGDLGSSTASDHSGVHATIGDAEYSPNTKTTDHASRPAREEGLQRPQTSKPDLRYDITLAIKLPAELEANLQGVQRVQYLKFLRIYVAAQRGNAVVLDIDDYKVEGKLLVYEGVLNPDGVENLTFEADTLIHHELAALEPGEQRLDHERRVLHLGSVELQRSVYDEDIPPLIVMGRALLPGGKPCANVCNLVLQSIRDQWGGGEDEAIHFDANGYFVAEITFPRRHGIAIGLANSRRINDVVYEYPLTIPSASPLLSLGTIELEGGIYSPEVPQLTELCATDANPKDLAFKLQYDNVDVWGTYDFASLSPERAIFAFTGVYSARIAIFLEHGRRDSDWHPFTVKPGELTKVKFQFGPPDESSMVKVRVIANGEELKSAVVETDYTTNMRWLQRTGETIRYRQDGQRLEDVPENQQIRLLDGLEHSHWIGNSPRQRPVGPRKLGCASPSVFISTLLVEHADKRLPFDAKLEDNRAVIVWADGWLPERVIVPEGRREITITLKRPRATFEMRRISVRIDPRSEFPQQLELPAEIWWRSEGEYGVVPTYLSEIGRQSWISLPSIATHLTLMEDASNTYGFVEPQLAPEVALGETGEVSFLVDKPLTYQPHTFGDEERNGGRAFGLCGSDWLEFRSQGRHRSLEKQYIFLDGVAFLNNWDAEDDTRELSLTRFARMGLSDYPLITGHYQGSRYKPYTYLVPERLKVEVNGFPESPTNYLLTLDSPELNTRLIVGGEGEYSLYGNPGEATLRLKYDGETLVRRDLTLTSSSKTLVLTSKDSGDKRLVLFEFQNLPATAMVFEDRQEFWIQAPGSTEAAKSVNEEGSVHLQPGEYFACVTLAGAIVKSIPFTVDVWTKDAPIEQRVHLDAGGFSQDVGRLALGLPEVIKKPKAIDDVNLSTWPTHSLALLRNRDLEQAPDWRQALKGFESNHLPAGHEYVVTGHCEIDEELYCLKPVTQTTSPKPSLAHATWLKARKVKNWRAMDDLAIRWPGQPVLDVEPHCLPIGTIELVALDDSLKVMWSGQLAVPPGDDPFELPSALVEEIAASLE